jgi:hypothetical protein
MEHIVQCNSVIVSIDLQYLPLNTVHLFTGAGPMQAPGLFDISDKRGKYGLVHNIGLGGAVVVSLLRRPEFFKAGGVDGRTRHVYFWLSQGHL